MQGVFGVNNNQHHVIKEAMKSNKKHSNSACEYIHIVGAVLLLYTLKLNVVDCIFSIMCIIHSDEFK